MLDFRSELLNFFNTPQFDKPGVMLALATFGKITNTVNKGRQVQFIEVHRLVAAFFNVIGISEHARVGMRNE